MRDESGRSPISPIGRKGPARHRGDMGRGKSENQMTRLWHRHRRHTRNGRACVFKMRVSSLDRAARYKCTTVHVSHLSGEQTGRQLAGGTCRRPPPREARLRVRPQCGDIHIVIDHCVASERTSQLNNSARCRNRQSGSDCSTNFAAGREHQHAGMHAGCGREVFGRQA